MNSQAGQIKSLVHAAINVIGRAHLGWQPRITGHQADQFRKLAAAVRRLSLSFYTPDLGRRGRVAEMALISFWCHAMPELP